MAAIAVYVVLSFVPSALADLPPPTIVSFQGQNVHLAGPVTAGQFFELQGIQLVVGRFLDVTGAVLKPSAYPPEIVVNGQDATTSTVLGSGDVVELRGGRDVTEPSVLETFANAGGNPQFKLGAGSVTVRRGLVSKSTVPVTTEGEGPPQVALTFDDGPDPRSTPKILDELKHAGIKATFFVVGTMAARYPKLVRREVADGMAVGDHTWSHPHLARQGESYVADQIGRTSRLLRTLGAEVTLFRPPYGSYGPQTVSIASALGMRTVIWTIDPSDYRKPAPGVIVGRIMSRLKPGSIILMHDGGGDRSHTVAAVKILIEQIRKRGYDFSVLR